MKINPKLTVAAFAITIAIVLGISVVAAPNAFANDLWVTAYYGAWMQGGPGWTGHMTADKIDYSAVTHIIHFTIFPKHDGTLDFTTGSVTLENSADLVKRAKAAGKKVLISVGG